jgi:tryptophan synthase beta chain
LHEPSESQLDVICLSGRGDKDLAQIIERYGADPADA